MTTSRQLSSFSPQLILVTTEWFSQWGPSFRTLAKTSSVTLLSLNRTLSGSWMREVLSISSLLWYHQSPDLSLHGLRCKWTQLQVEICSPISRPGNKFSTKTLVLLCSTLTSLIKIRPPCSTPTNPSQIFIRLTSQMGSILIKPTGKYLAHKPMVNPRCQHQSFSPRYTLCLMGSNHLAKARTHLSKSEATNHLNSRQAWVCHSKVIKCLRKLAPMQVWATIRHWTTSLQRIKSG